jgi:hypothetical protein
MTMSSKSDVSDAIAKYILCLAREPSYWFTLNSSCDDDDDGNGDNGNANHDECHLSHRLGMNQNEYRALLVAAGLARFHPGGGGNKFHICRDTWCNNLRGHPRFVSTTEIIPYPLFELSTCRLSVIHGYRQPVSVHAIRIGRKIMNVPPTSLSSQKRANIPPPEMSNELRLSQQALRQSTELAIIAVQQHRTTLQMNEIEKNFATHTSQATLPLLSSFSNHNNNFDTGDNGNDEDTREDYEKFLPSRVMHAR